ncbi:Ubiquinone biosynthesis O-methyltransferase [Porphyridium purpureum]|uniref:Ubiquinone biosynthesis O-methyltransferase, mitochondrial n=1 Tax=Porphyridium purpureum TaxID=35688 RepID=A0A5J4Z356_PORPP|nr:Ubiquinone biosynthesis O-methyltransferase [Porphyridium purpureum]|eukprot:POR2185..scf295_1
MHPKLHGGSRQSDVEDLHGQGEGRRGKDKMIRSWVAWRHLRSLGQNVRRCSSSPQSPSVDAAEILKFNALSAKWWNTQGHAAFLHRMNPARVAFIRSVIESLLLRKDAPLAVLTDREEDGSGTCLPLHSVSVLDVGCGGGLVAEPLARLGAKVTGIDGAGDAVRVANEHAKMEASLRSRLEYRHATVEQLVQEQRAFDVVTALEIVEHVNQPREFVASCAALVSKKGGLLVLSTINRTPLSYAATILGAEKLTRIIPSGTHDWNRYITPGELGAVVEGLGFTVERVVGLHFNPLSGVFFLSERNLDINYIMVAAWHPR